MGFWFRYCIHFTSNIQWSDRFINNDDMLIFAGISIERDDDLGEDSSIGPLFLGLELAPSNVRYVPTTFSQELLTEADYGAIIGMTLTVMSVILVLLIAVIRNSILSFFRISWKIISFDDNFKVSLVVYSKIIRRRTTSIHLGNDVYRTTIDGQEQLVPLQKYQIDSFQSFAVEENHKLAHLIQTVWL